MQYSRFILLILIICNYSFSQDKNTELSKDNQILQKPEVFKFHPNPVQDQLFILGTHKIKRVEIIDALGKTVVLEYFDKSIIRLNVKPLESGLYFLKVIDKFNKQDIKKLIVK